MGLHRHLTPEELIIAIDLHQSGMAVTHIAMRLGYSPQVMKRELEEAGIEVVMQGKRYK